VSRIISMSSERKAPAAEGNHNADFCDALMEIAAYEKNVNRNSHKYNAYRKAAEILSKLDHRIQSGAEAQQLSGVGASIARKLDEIIQTGKLKKLDLIRDDDESVAVNQLTRVSGIGPVKAKELFGAGIDSIERLQENLDSLTHAQQIGLKYLTDFEERIPRAEIKTIESRIREVLTKQDPAFTMIVCGSFRRGGLSSGDVDLLVTHSGLVASQQEPGREGAGLLHGLVTALQAGGVVCDTISLGDTKFMGVCRAEPAGLARRLDIRLLDRNEFYCGVLYFTGSDLHNKAMRGWAVERRFTLNEYSLRPVERGGRPGLPLPVSSERDVFEYLDFPFKPPSER